jgi:hypothetical protein
VTGRGRPRADRLALVERVALLLLDDPSLTANAIQLIVGARRVEVLRAVRAARSLLEANPNTDYLSGSASPNGRFPYPESGCSGEAPR